MKTWQLLLLGAGAVYLIAKSSKASASAAESSQAADYAKAQASAQAEATGSAESTEDQLVGDLEELLG